MDSLLNASRPPVFCPGCAHDRVVHALDKAFQNMGLPGEGIAIVSDIGCSGLFDTFFNTHAFHGLHGRALTYATGIKMARPDLNVVVTMGDGGLGIGGAHVLSTCRRNVDITLLVLNNFNYGMTGGQCSATTPPDAAVGSGFLNCLEKPYDICQIAGAAGAPYLARLSTYQKDLSDQMERAIRFKGFSLLDIWGVCTGRYTKRNTLTPQIIAEDLSRMPPLTDVATGNARPAYEESYREQAARMPSVPPPQPIAADFTAPRSGRTETVILGSAGQRIVTAGEILCLAGITAGLHASQKNDYPITVLRGHSVSELIVSSRPIGYTGIDRPAVVIALASEGVKRRQAMFGRLPADCLVIKANDVQLPPGSFRVLEIDFKAGKIKPQDRALAALTVMAREQKVLTLDMLKAALAIRFNGTVLAGALALVEKVAATAPS